MQKHYYDILGISSGASLKDIRQAYRRLAREWHPDINPNQSSQVNRFLEISEAYRILSNPDNQQITNGEKANEPPKNNYITGRRNLLSNVDTAYTYEESYFNEIIETYINRGTSSIVRLSTRRKYTEYPLNITLEEAFKGISTTVPINYGPDSVRLNIEIDIPRGIEDGSRIRINTGNIITEGDIYFRINIAPHDYFTRYNEHLYHSVSLDFIDALLGTEIQIPTMTGQVLLKIPPNTRDGSLFRLSGRGMPNNDLSKKTGNIYVAIQLYYPQNLLDDVRNLLAQFRYMRQMRRR